MITELQRQGEACTAVITSHMDSGENFDGAILIGFYPGQPDEMWIEAKGVRFNVQCADVDGLCKQIKRAKKLAQEEEPQS